jgi:hypothetical protein
MAETIKIDPKTIIEILKALEALKKKFQALLK